MILPLRVRHRRTITALALFLPLGVFAALGLRPVFPVSKTSASELVEPGPGEPFIEPGFSMTMPDVLVYLVPGEFSGGSLPDDAVLLGSLSGTKSRFRVPAGFQEGGYTLVYYSLGHGRVVLTKRM